MEENWKRMEEDWRRMEEDEEGFLKRRGDGRGLEEDGRRWKRVGEGLEEDGGG